MYLKQDILKGALMYGSVIFKPSSLPAKGKLMSLPKTFCLKKSQYNFQ
jgi:hypothetical protein